MGRKDCGRCRIVPDYMGLPAAAKFGSDLPCSGDLVFAHDHVVDQFGKDLSLASSKTESLIPPVSF